MKHSTAEDVSSQQQINASWSVKVWLRQTEVRQILPIVIEWDWMGWKIGDDFG